MKRLLYLLLLMLFTLTLTACSRKEKGLVGPDASPDALPDLAGTYAVNGVDPLNTEYSGHLTIWAGEQPGTYQMQWIIVGSIQEGTGVVEGNQLVVEWHSTEGFAGESSGTSTYIISVNGELSGVRNVDGLSQPGVETAFPNQ